MKKRLYRLTAACEKISEEAFAGDLQAKLDSFFDEEGQVRISFDDEVVPLQPPPGPGGTKSR